MVELNATWTSKDEVIPVRACDVILEIVVIGDADEDGKIGQRGGDLRVVDRYRLSVLEGLSIG
jgi:hypothetical protein